METKKKTTKPKKAEEPKSVTIPGTVIRYIRETPSLAHLANGDSADVYLDCFTARSVTEICSRRLGRTPIWTEPEELMHAFRIYEAWTDANPIITYELIRSGPMAGTLMEIPRKYMRSETDFSMFLGAAPNYLCDRRAQYVSNYEEFGLDACLAFVDVIDRIKKYISNDTDRGAASQQLDPNYVRALRGLKTALDYTSGGEQIKGGLTISVMEPRTVSKIKRLKEFTKEHKGEEDAKE